MSDPVFGIAIRRIDEDPRPVIGADLSTIGIIGPCDSADDDTFPLNDPVFLNSNSLQTLALLGEDGLIPDAIRGINDQLGETQFAARIVMVRTAYGTDADPTVAMQQTIANVVGNSLTGTGIFAFLRSAHKLGFTPRIIIAPGYTSQMATGVGNITQVEDGVGYSMDHRYEITFSSGGADAVQATGHAFGLPDGSLGPVLLDMPGAWYSSNPTVTAPAPYKEVSAAAVHSGAIGSGYAVNDTIRLPNNVELEVDTVDGSGGITAVTVLESGNTPYPDEPADNPILPISTSGTGTGASFDLTWVDAGTTATYTAVTSVGANPFCASITSVLNQVYGHAIVESSGASMQNDTDWRETMQSQRIIPISGGCRVLDPVSSFVVFRPLAPRIAGILVRRDHEKGAPFHSAANQPIQGIIGPMRDIGFSLTDNANEGQELLGFNIGIVVRGEVGDDFAIASGGFVFIGTDNAGEDELWRFYNVMRGRDYIHLGLIKALRFFLGRYNITGHTIMAILQTMKYFLRDLYADGHILGYKVVFRVESNSAEKIRLGHLAVGFKAEEPPPLRLIIIESQRYRDAIDAMVADVAAQLNLSTS
jgi:Bacteriophage tail sheath protein